MPTKKTSAPRRKRRASTIVRTVYRRARRTASIPRSGLGGHLFTKILLFFGGYTLGDTLDQTGLAKLAYDRIPMAKQLADSAYAAAGTTAGPAFTKTAGVAAFIHTLYNARKGGKVNGNELAFALGAMADDPTYGSTSGLPGSGGSQGYWSS